MSVRISPYLNPMLKIRENEIGNSKSIMKVLPAFQKMEQKIFLSRTYMPQKYYFDKKSIGIPL